MSPRHLQLLGIAAGRGAGTRGVEDGPAALREIGLIGALEAAGHTVEDLGDISDAAATEPQAPAFNVHDLGHVLQVNRHTHACIVGTRRRAPDHFLLTVGGDHSLAIGSLAGLADTCERLGLLWIDAHGDFNTPETSPSGNAHGMCVAVACGRGHLELRSIADHDPFLAESDVYMFGVRDLDIEERRILEESEVTLLEMPAWRERGFTTAVLEAAEALAQRCDHVHMSFDIDVLDATHVPGTGTPVGGGLNLADALELLSAISERDCLSSAEFVEYNPHLDPSGNTGRVTLQLIETFARTEAAK
jgi:arginase